MDTKSISSSTSIKSIQSTNSIDTLNCSTKSIKSVSIPSHFNSSPQINSNTTDTETKKPQNTHPPHNNHHHSKMNHSNVSSTTTNTTARTERSMSNSSSKKTQRDSSSLIFERNVQDNNANNELSKTISNISTNSNSLPIPISRRSSYITNHLITEDYISPILDSTVELLSNKDLHLADVDLVQLPTNSNSNSNSTSSFSRNNSTAISPHSISNSTSPSLIHSRHQSINYSSPINRINSSSSLLGQRKKQIQQQIPTPQPQNPPQLPILTKQHSLSGLSRRRTSSVSAHNNNNNNNSNNLNNSSNNISTFSNSVSISSRPSLNVSTSTTNCTTTHQGNSPPLYRSQTLPMNVSLAQSFSSPSSPPMHPHLNQPYQGQSPTNTARQSLSFYSFSDLINYEKSNNNLIDTNHNNNQMINPNHSSRSMSNPPIFRASYNTSTHDHSQRLPNYQNQQSVSPLSSRAMSNSSSFNSSPPSTNTSVGGFNRRNSQFGKFNDIVTSLDEALDYNNDDEDEIDNDNDNDNDNTPTNNNINSDGELDTRKLDELSSDDNDDGVLFLSNSLATSMNIKPKSNLATGITTNMSKSPRANKREKRDSIDSNFSFNSSIQSYDPISISQSQQQQQAVPGFNKPKMRSRNSSTSLRSSVSYPNQSNYFEEELTSINSNTNSDAVSNGEGAFGEPAVCSVDDAIKFRSRRISNAFNY